MPTKFILSLFFAIAFLPFLNAQNGFVRGTVFDGSNGEYLPGVTIFAEGTTAGTITDLDGKFNLSLAPGVYDLRVSFISYETLKINGVKVLPGQVNSLDNLKLKQASIDITEVTVSAQMVRNTDNALLTMKKKSANLLDGLSASGLKKTGDSDAAASVKRIPGVSVEGGKYVFVRGLGDRYTKIMLNGLDIPGLDPDRNTLQMDIFPSNIIDNIIVNKSFTAELPADFTGGAINIETKDFPEERKSNIQGSFGYNPNYHFNSNYLTYEGGKTDMLGFDDGTREIPATENIPFFSEVIANPNGEKGTRYKEILNAFDPTLAAMKEQSFMDYSFGFSMGNQFPYKKITLGYNLAFSYKNNTEFFKDAEYGRYGLLSDSSINEMETREYQKGDFGTNSVLWSGMAGFAVKTKNSKYRINLLHLQNGESKAGIFNYVGSDQGSNFEAIQHNLEYSQRSMSNMLVSGKHSFASNTWSLEWKFSPTLSKMEDPDIRFTRYGIRGSGFAISTEYGFPERIWRTLEETNFSGSLHIEKEFDFMGQKSKLHFGGNMNQKERDFSIYNYNLNIRGITLTGDPNELFKPENLWPYNGNPGRGTTYEAPFYPDNSNQFNASIQNTAAFVSAELGLYENLRGIFGVRMENYTQWYTGQDQSGENALDNKKVLDKLNFFPSINFIYNLTENQNLRLSYTKTIARPSFKELSFAEIFDPVSGRAFMGGLFPDKIIRGTDTTIYWDGNLVPTDVQNFDFRWEAFQDNGQMVSGSLFYKTFHKPIEMVQYITQTGSFQPRNVGDGKVLGAELELRQSFGFIHDELNNLLFSSNFSYIYSRIELSKTELESRKNNARAGQEIKSHRAMAGQSPLIVNCGISFTGEKPGFWKGLEAGIFYNVQGRTLQIVGINDRPDIYTLPFHSVNVNITKSFGEEKRLQLGLKIDNLLNQKKATVFQSYEAKDKYDSMLKPGTSFQFKISYNLF